MEECPPEYLIMRASRFYQKWMVIGFAGLAIVWTAPPALAWGRLGHRVIARLAEKHMTPEAKNGAAALLGSGESMADASLWAD
jgi:hypothetical protein